MESMAIIYGIFDSLGACVYVGRTKMTLQQRFISHKAKARRSGSSPFHIWLKNELQSSRNIEAIELEKCPESLMSKRESFWIKKLSPAKNVAKPHDGGKKKCDIDWSPFIHMLGIDYDSEIALLAGVTRKAVSYKRKCLEIPATKKPQRVVISNSIGGWNKKKITKECEEMLGKAPDHEVAGVFGFSKKKIGSERKSRGIKSYAEQSGNDGKIKKDEPHRRWNRRNAVSVNSH